MSLEPPSPPMADHGWGGGVGHWGIFFNVSYGQRGSNGPACRPETKATARTTLSSDFHIQTRVSLLGSVEAAGCSLLVCLLLVIVYQNSRWSAKSQCWLLLPSCWKKEREKNGRIINFGAHRFKAVKNSGFFLAVPIVKIKGLKDFWIGSILWVLRTIF